MRTGAIKSFDFKGGYGFIAPDEGGPDVFLHASIVTNEKILHGFKIGARVRYLQEQRPDGKLKASSVELELRVVVIDLPDHCSHRFAARCDDTGETAVFHNPAELVEWRRAQKRKVGL